MSTDRQPAVRFVRTCEHHTADAREEAGRIVCETCGAVVRVEKRAAAK